MITLIGGWWRRSIRRVLIVTSLAGALTLLVDEGVGAAAPDPQSRGKTTQSKPSSAPRAAPPRPPDHLLSPRPSPQCSASR